MSILDEMYNTWVLYWDPAGYNGNGTAKLASPEPILANWREGIDEEVVIDGKKHRVDHSVYVAERVKPGGVMMRVDHDIMLDSATVKVLEDLTVPPVDGEIRAVTMQNDLDDFSDQVFRALI